MSKHTPGPHHAAPEAVDGRTLYYSIRCAAGHMIGTAGENLSPFDGKPVTMEEARANADLFAAASDLLAFARECARHDSDCGPVLREAARELVWRAQEGTP